MDLRVPVRQMKISEVGVTQTHVIPEVSPFPDVDRLLELDCRSVISAIMLASRMYGGRSASVPDHPWDLLRDFVDGAIAETVYTGRGNNVRIDFFPATKGANVSNI
jgi:hypothetical protein